MFLGVEVPEREVWDNIGEGERAKRMHRIPSVAGVLLHKSTNYRALLRKMTYKDKAFYGSWPPCTRLKEAGPKP